MKYPELKNGRYVDVVKGREFTTPQVRIYQKDLPKVTKHSTTVSISTKPSILLNKLKLDFEDKEQVKEWIRLNREALLFEWHETIKTQNEGEGEE